MAKTKFSIADNIDEVLKFYVFDQKKIVEKASRAAINRGTSKQLTNLDRVIRERRNIKKGKLKRFLSKQLSKGTLNLNEIEGKVRVSGQPVPLIAYVVGKKTPRNQKGKNVSQRRKLKIEITKGKKRVSKHGFIARAKKGARFQVFKRKGTKSFPMSVQSTPAMSRFVQKTKLSDRVMEDSKPVIRKEFFRVLRVFMDKEVGKVKKNLRVRR